MTVEVRRRILTYDSGSEEEDTYIWRRKGNYLLPALWS
jgi:hypothetical protein